MKKLILGLTATAFSFFSPTSAFAGDPIFDAYDAYVGGNYQDAYAKFLPIAESGNNDAQFIVGSLYFEGQGVAQSFDNAAKWFVKSANGGNVTAMLSLGEMYETDRLGPNIPEAKRWYKMAADAGNKLGQTKYDALNAKPEIPQGFSIYNDKPTPSADNTLSKAEQDALSIAGRTKADGFYDQPQEPIAKSNGFTSTSTTSVKPLPKIDVGPPYKPWTRIEADEMLANMADKSITNNFNAKRYTDVREEALKFAKRGMVRYQLIIGKTYFLEKNYPEAMRWYKRAAAAEDTGTAFIYIPEAQFLVGSMYYLGLGVPENRNLAAGWYALAANHTSLNKKAAYELGKMYETGKYIPQDDEKAIHYFTKAGRDNGEALFRIGVLYEQNIAKYALNKYLAFEYYEQSAATGNSLGQFALGTAYSDGKLTSQSYAKAREWYEKSAAQDNPDAQHNLAMLYANGQGVPQSYEKAVAWLKKAAGQDFALSQYTLGVFYADGKGVKQNDMMAIFWLKKAAELGDKPAQDLLKESGITW